jgi:hypothetical protein
MDKQTKRKLQTKRQFSEQIRRQAIEEFRGGNYTAKELVPTIQNITAASKLSTGGFINTLHRINLK